MPQVFQVLRCYKCFAFQVHQTKKSNKWDCKLCGEKQSVKRHYGIGTAKDCRLHVQKLNSMRGEKDELKCGQMIRNNSSDSETETGDLESIEVASELQPVSSKWSDFLDLSQTVEEDKNEPTHLGDLEVVLEIPKKRKKNLSNYCKSNRNTVCNTQSKSCSIDLVAKDKTSIPCSNTIGLKHMGPPNIQVSHSDYLTESIDKENRKSNINCNKNIPFVMNKRSKWAEYIEEDSEVTSPGSVDKSQHSQIFSLCDDSELDNVLNI